MSLRYSTGFVSATFNPLLNPNAPTIGTATAGVGQISITFTAPAIVGGSAITEFIATARRTSDGTTVSATGASSPIVITGLAGADFTVRVAAVNLSGPSAFSAASNTVTVLAIGSAFGGGFFAGQISTTADSVATHNLVVGPLSTAQTQLQWKNVGTATPGANSNIDGPQNTADMVADGNSTVYPCAHFCNDLVTGGFSDWYMPAPNELEVCYFNLKPTTQANTTLSGINPNSVPERTANYTTSVPARTSVTAFQSGGAEAFTNASYWSSADNDAIASNQALRNRFGYGLQGGNGKTYSYRVRAIRRVPV